ncbi:hypothetical protein C3486_22510 [Streptomyces sp. Ru73]|uniref:hypothetical protein n=1 Tax=Streptomyces sp. Ru73 TaxID=2080748 RepID=UPI000CDD41C1|nr:hypothetical protein [Streptomyces sp. Ru73]POX38593.1 hypothetical protein C3486_22510 [Streptomyces sp. Ru73]
MVRSVPTTDDYGLIAPITLPPDGHAPGDVSGPAEYDAFFRIAHDDVSAAEWSAQALSVSQQVTEDLQTTSLADGERADLLDGIAVLLQHALRITADQQ